MSCALTVVVLASLGMSGCYLSHGLARDDAAPPRTDGGRGDDGEVTSNAILIP